MFENVIPARAGIQCDVPLDSRCAGVTSKIGAAAQLGAAA
jgi:hypothetical protein